jgi:hypothetical protein
MDKPRLVANREELLTNVFGFSDDLRLTEGSAKVRLANALTYTRSWSVAYNPVRRKLCLGPSKYVGYAQITPDRYDASFKTTVERLDGRETEAAMRTLIAPISDTEAAFPTARDAIVAFCAEFGKEPNNIARISYVRGNPPVLDGECTPLLIGELLAARVEISLTMSRELRSVRLAHASKIVLAYPTQTLIYNRNPDVVAEALDRACGVCEGCLTAAPFERSNGTPFLEVHHVKPLAKGEEDSIENVKALCPNCHRREHHGPPRWKWD